MKDRGSFNPLATENLGRSVATALLNCPLEPLSKVPRFQGAGIYALYYAGNEVPYDAIAIGAAVKGASVGLEQVPRPIYVGKAVPEGKRKGKVAANGAGTALFRRVNAHRKSIEAASTTLRIEDFYCKCLVVDPLFITLGESLMIAWFSPIWNQVLDGFGNNAPGRGREKGVRSRWDTVHPGRPSAMKLIAREETREQLIEEMRVYLANTQGSIRDVDLRDLKVAEHSPDEYSDEE